jgi:ERCC4-type nuclease
MRRLIVVVDTREQSPWEFEAVPTVRRALKFGDYALRGGERLCAVERKSAVDLAGTLAGGFARMVREFKRAADAGARLFLLTECTFLDFEGVVAKWSPGKSARSAVARFAAETGVVPLFCGTRKRAASMALALLREHLFK